MRPAYGGKSGLASNDHVIVAAGTVNNLNIAALVPAAHNANVSIIGIENQVAGLGLGPGNGGAVGVLRTSASTVAQDITAA